jgi:hypothetical protein
LLPLPELREIGWVFLAELYFGLTPVLGFKGSKVVQGSRVKRVKGSQRVE